MRASSVWRTTVLCCWPMGSSLLWPETCSTDAACRGAACALVVVPSTHCPNWRRHPSMQPKVRQGLLHCHRFLPVHGLISWQQLTHSVQGFFITQEWVFEFPKKLFKRHVTVAVQLLPRTTIRIQRKSEEPMQRNHTSSATPTRSPSSHDVCT